MRTGLSGGNERGNSRRLCGRRPAAFKKKGYCWRTDQSKFEKILSPISVNFENLSMEDVKEKRRAPSRLSETMTDLSLFRKADAADHRIFSSMIRSA